MSVRFTSIVWFAFSLLLRPTSSRVNLVINYMDTTESDLNKLARIMFAAVVFEPMCL